MEQEELYLSSFRALEPGFADGDPDWLYRIRQEAIQAFAERGFPTTHDEEWRFTNVAPLTKTLFQIAPDESDTWAGAGLERALDAGPATIRLVFVNGFYSERLSAVRGFPVRIHGGNLASILPKGNAAEAHLARYADHRSHPFVALNTAFWRDGAYLRFPKGTVVAQPVNIVYVSTADEIPLLSSPRSLIVVERDAEVRVVESYLGLGAGTCFSNAVTEIVVGENSRFDHCRLQWENDLSYHMGALRIYQERNSRFSSVSVSLGGALARNEVNAVLDAPGADCELNGLYLVRGRQHVDNHTTLDHTKPNCASRELYNGILDGHSTGVFNGRIVVRPGAQKTNAIQKNRNLLLTEEAMIDTKPQLEIYNNDVRCTHGATIGQLDPDALFYLRSRGIGYENARKMLIYAFAGDVLGRVTPPCQRAWLEEALQTRLSQGLLQKEGL